MIASRQEKADWFLKFFKEAKKKKVNLSKKFIISDFCLTFNSSRRTGQEILSLLADRGYCIIQGDVVVVK